MSYYGGSYCHQEDWDPEYDSTWDDDGEDEQPKSKKVKTSHQLTQHRRAARDMQNYRHGYPDKSPKPNLLFYQNKIPFEPHGKNIEYIHEHWRNQYNTVESNHNFIQWLFPLREHGVNRCATPLTLSEIELMKADEQVMARILESYKLMLGFYGIVLVDTDTGMVARAEDNWEDRFDNLNYHTHNNLRITRILKCLGEMGYEKFQAPLVRFFLEETLCNDKLTNVKESALEYFMFAVKDKKERQKLVRFAWMNYKPQERFIWGPVDKFRKFKCEGDGPEELKLQMITPKNERSEGYSAVDSEISGNMSENRVGLVRRVSGYIAWPFLVLIWLGKSPFLVFFRLVFRPARGFFRSCFFWFRGKARNEDGLNEGQISVKTDGTETEKTKDANMPTVNTPEDYNERAEGVIVTKSEGLPKDHVKKKRSKAKELDVSAGRKSMEERENEAKLKIEVNGNKCETVLEDGRGTGDFKPLANIKISEPIQGKEDYKNVDDLAKMTKYTKSTNVMKLDQGLASGNEHVEGTKESSEAEDNDSGVGQDSGGHTNDSRADNRGGTQTDNAEHQLEETKIYSGKTEINNIDGNGQLLIVGPKHNDGWTIETRNILPDTVKEEQFEREHGKTEDEIAASEKPVPPFRGEGDAAENADISSIDGNGQSVTVGSKHNDGGTIGTPNILPDAVKEEQFETEDGKTEDEKAASEKPVPPFRGEEDAAENADISSIDGNGQSVTVRSKHNDGGTIGTQNILPDAVKKEQFETEDGKTEDEKAASEKPVPPFRGEGDAAENADISSIDGNGQSVTVGSKHNDGGTIRTQNILPDSVKAEKFARDDRKTEDEKAASDQPVPPFRGEEDASENADISSIDGNGQSVTVGSKHNDGGTIGTQNILPEIDQTEQVVEQLQQYDGERDEDENLEISKTDGNRNTRTMGSKDNEGLNIRTQNRWPEIDQTEQVVEQLQQYDGERDEDENLRISKTEGNRNTRTMGSKDNDGENIRTQNTEHEKVKTEQDEKVDLTIANVYLDPETEEKVNETLESVGGSRETVHSEIYTGENKQEDIEQ